MSTAWNSYALVSLGEIGGNHSAVNDIFKLIYYLNS